MNSKRTILGILLLGVVLPIFLQLGERGLNEPDEGRYAEIGREMAVTGDWLVPRLNGVPHYAKPPWMYWCIALSLKIFGFNEWAARLPTALAAVATALTVFAFGRKMHGSVAGLISALVLVTTVFFFIVARLITPDMMLTACITLALFCFWSWFSLRSSIDETSDRKSWRWLLGMYLALGIGFLDKGPLVLAVTFLSIVGFLLFQKKGQEIPKLGLIRGIFLVAVMALPWFLIMCQLNPDLYDFYLRGEIKDRILEGHGRAHSWYYHLVWLPGDCWPWTILAGCAFWTHFRQWRKREEDASSSCFLLCWFVFPFIFYSILSSKLPTYILPVIPPISLMMGIWLAPRFFGGRRSVVAMQPGGADGSAFAAKAASAQEAAAPSRGPFPNGIPPFWSQLATCILLPAPAAVFFWYIKLRPHASLTAIGKLALATLLLGIGIWCFIRWLENNRVLSKGLAWLGLRLPFRFRPLGAGGGFGRQAGPVLWLGVWWLTSMVTLHGVVFKMNRLESQLGHNSSWRELTRALEGVELVGIPITGELHPVARRPEFARAGPRVTMYEFYFRSGSFYLMKGKREIIPFYGGETLWEIKGDVEMEKRAGRNEMVALLKGSERVYVFTHPQYRDELQTLTGLKLPLIKSEGKGEHEAVLFSNKESTASSAKSAD